MKRLNKLYEAIAVVNQARSKLMLGFIGLKFDKKTRELLSPRASEISKQLDELEYALELLLDTERERGAK